MPKTLTFDEMMKTVTGTSLRGYITATRKEIEAVFGEPTFADNDPTDKVTTEWYIQFDDGTFGTIYDWKRYEAGAPRMGERTEWNIGGHDDSVRRSIANAMSRQVTPAG